MYLLPEGTELHNNKGSSVRVVPAVLAFGRSAQATHDAGRAGRSDVTVAARVTHDSQVAAMSSWWRGRRTTRRPRRSPRCRPGGAGDARRAGRRDATVAARVTHDSQVAAMSSWWRGRRTTRRPRRSRPCHRGGAGDARRAGRGDVVVAAAPGELHAFFVPAAMCSRLVARRGQRTTRRSPRCRRGGCPLGAPRVLRARRDVLAFSRSARVTHDAQVAQVAAMSSWRLLPGSSARSSCPPRCAHVWSLGAGDALRADRAGRQRCRCGCSLGAPCVLCARHEVNLFSGNESGCSTQRRVSHKPTYPDMLECPSRNHLVSAC